MPPPPPPPPPSDDLPSLQCPRCHSLDTKFCYYNNYSTSQPRHFCKHCKRYWTAGGSLRNIPVGGALRKDKKPKSTPSKRGCFASADPPLFSSSASASAYDDESQKFVNPSPSSSADKDSDDVFRSGFPPLTSLGCADLVAQDQSGAYDYYHHHHHHADFNRFVDIRSFNSHSAPPAGTYLQQFSGDGANYGRYYYGINGWDGNSGEVSEVASEASYQGGGGGALAGGEIQQGRNSRCSATPDSRWRDHRSQAEEDDDDDLGDVVNVTYPFDWDQVSEVLFGGSPDLL